MNTPNHSNMFFREITNSHLNIQNIPQPSQPFPPSHIHINKYNLPYNPPRPKIPINDYLPFEQQQQYYQNHINHQQDQQNQDENKYNNNIIQSQSKQRMPQYNPYPISNNQVFLDINPCNLFYPQRNSETIQYQQQQQQQQQQSSNYNTQQSHEHNKQQCKNISCKCSSHSNSYNHNNQIQMNNQQQQNNQDQSYYLEAKKCELYDQDLDGAVYFYLKCLEYNQKRDSAVKDLATVYHKQGKTQVAIDLLIKEKENYQGDMRTYDNLIATLEKQLVPTGKVYLKFILMYSINLLPISQEHINSIFPKIMKAKNIYYFKDLSLVNQSDGPSHICLLEFNSYSNAKKVIEGSPISHSSTIKCFLVDIMGKIKIYIQDNKNYDRELIEYHNPFLKPSTFPESLMFLYKDRESQDIINSEDKKYCWLQDSLIFESISGQDPLLVQTRLFENKKTIELLINESSNFYSIQNYQHKQ